MKSTMMINALRVTAFAAALLTAGVSSAADVYLQAESFTKNIPDGGSGVNVPMWGFAQCDSTFTTCDPVNSPGPQIEVDLATDTSLTIHVNNTLPIPVSVIAPGLSVDGDPVMMPDGLGRSRVRSLTHETASSSTATYNVPLKAGTYLYQSGSWPSLEVPMGLYGALVVTNANGTEAYPADSTHSAITPNSEAMLLFSELDPIQNQRVVDAAAVGVPTQQCVSLRDYVDNAAAGYPCTVDYYPVITLINGETSASMGMGEIDPGDLVLLRMLNAGQRTHVPAIVNQEMTLITEDGNRYPGNPLVQTEALLTAGKTLDALIQTMPAVDVTLAIFDHMPTYKNDADPNALNELASVVIGAGTTVTAPTIFAVNDDYAVPEDAAPYNSAFSVLANDVGTSGATVSVNTDVSYGTLVFNTADGSFTYTPDPNFSGTDTFSYVATLAGQSYPANVMLNVSFVNDVPVANPDAYSNAVGSTVTVDAAHGVLGNDVDEDGDTLTAVLDGVVTGLTLHADGSFEYAGSSTTFSYYANDGTANSAVSATVTINVGTPSNIALNVTEPDGTTTVDSYRWIVQEDATFHVDPNSPPDPADMLSTNFHKSYMPVVAQGCVGAECATDNLVIPVAAFTQAVLDPTKHYYVSVLPNDAGTGVGHSLGGAQIPAGTVSPATIDVVVNTQPIPTAQISVIVFEDIAPTNGVPDAGESGLGGFEILLEDAAGRYGQPPGTVNFDVNGEPLRNALDCFGGTPQPRGVILTCPDGTALIQNLPPGKFGVIVTPAAGAGTWTQTSTIEGTNVQDTWVQAGEPPFLTEFGAPGYHAFIGFVNPDHTTLDPTPGPPGHSISGNVTMTHSARAPDNTAWDSGNYVALSHTRPWVGLNSLAGDGPNVATVQADLVADDATFTIPDIPDGTYQLVIWDDYLDQIIAYQTVTVAGGDIDVGNIPVSTWFGRHEHQVFLDDNVNANLDPGEIGLTEQVVNIRFRDGTIFQTYPTDSTGFVPFDQVFPFGNWQIAEIDYSRFKPTGVRVTVDGGGDVSGGPYPGLLNPQTGSPRTDTEPAPVLLEGFQSMPGMTSLFEWGKKPYVDGENGGIAGIVFYGSTRGENDPRLTVGDPWEPGIPGVTVRLHKEIPTAEGGTTLTLIDEVKTDSWDANLPTGCPGEDPTGPFVTETLNGDATRCFDGVRNFEQVRPGAVFDGGYAFGDLKPGAYVVEIVPPPGYEVIKEEDKNVDFGDVFDIASVPMMFAAAMVVLPDAAMVAEAQNPQWGLLAPPCVGSLHTVPATLSLFPNEVVTYAPFAGADRPLCNMKRVVLMDKQNAPADFHLFTATPVAGQYAGLSSDDVAIETNPASPTFSDKWGPAYMPFSQRDFMGNIVYYGYTDGFGHYNGLTPSTFSASIPIPSGYSPGMYSVCLNERVKPDGSPEPYHLWGYGTFCYTLMYMPGTTTYPDTPILPLAAFAAGYNPVDCALPDGSPVVVQVDGAGVGPLVAPNGSLTIYSRGVVDVPNPDYEGPLAGAPHNIPTIQRDYGFGSSAGTVSLGGTTLTVTSWADGVISATAPANPGEYELVVTNANGKQSINTVTVNVGTDTPTVVTAGGSIQAAIDAATAGSLIIVGPGVYSELVVMSKPVRLQGSGANTVIDAVKLPAAKLSAWQTRVSGLVNAGTVDLLPGQPDQLDLVGPGLLSTEQGAGITVLSKNDGSWTVGASRIDGFTITGADGGGGIYVNGYADNLVISNNNVTGNSGNLHGGIRIGQPSLPLVGTGPFHFDDNVNIHHNAITFNGGQADVAVGGGLSICTGTDGYSVNHNYICGNFNLGDGAGMGHYGLSNNGEIAFNQILFNQNFNQGIGAHGGGLLIAGEPPAATTLTLGSGNVHVDANLIQGNHAGSGNGGGVRTQFVNGEDVSASPNNNGNWWLLRMTNNTIVNNVAGGIGGGISMQDTVHAEIVLNTVAHNDSTSTVGALVGAGPQPAGISSELNSLGLNGTIPGNSQQKVFSNPTLTHNILWQNRAFTYDDSTGTARLLPVLAPGAVGDCAAGANYFDLGVTDPGFSLNPRFSVLTTGTGNNTSANPQFVHGYCNTARTLTAGPMQVAAEVIEGGNAVDVRYGPLTLEWPPGNGMWDYHIASTSSAIDRPGNQPSGTNVDHDIDNQDRPNGPRVDVGADEYVAGSTPPPAAGTPSFQSASLGTLGGGTLAFGDVGNTSSTLTVLVSSNPVQFGSVTVGNTNHNRFSYGGGTCQNSTVSASGTCTVIVDFNGSGGGAAGSTGTLTVNHNGTGSPLTLALTGS